MHLGGCVCVHMCVCVCNIFTKVQINNNIKIGVQLTVLLFIQGNNGGNMKNECKNVVFLP